MDNCIFCKIIKGEIPSITVYEDNNVKAFLDISQATKGHVLVKNLRLEDGTKKIFLNMTKDLQKTFLQKFR